MEGERAGKTLGRETTEGRCFYLGEEKGERVRGWRGGLQKRRSDMSKEKLRELYRVDRHACQNSRSAQARARSTNRTTSSSYTVASARPRALNTSALSRPLKEPREDGRRRTRSISKGLRGASRRNTTSGTPSPHRFHLSFLSATARSSTRPRAERVRAAARPSLPLTRSPCAGTPFYKNVTPPRRSIYT